MHKLLILAPLLLTATASPIGVSINDPLAAFTSAIHSRDAGNANDYMDMVLDNLNHLLPPTVPLPDFEMAGIHFTECYVYGLDAGISRVGDATMVTMEDTAKFTCEMATQEVGMSCRWSFMLMRGHAQGTTEIISISSGMSWKMISGNSPQVTEFRVTELAPIETDITGLTPLLNWLAEDIADIIINNFADSMVQVVEVYVKDLLQQVLDMVVLP